MRTFDIGKANIFLLIDLRDFFQKNWCEGGEIKIKIKCKIQLIFFFRFKANTVFKHVKC